MTEITRHEAREAARLVSQYRSRCAGPAWDRPGIEDALAAARHRADIADLIRAALRAATVPTNRTPAVIALDGDHWRGHDTSTPRRRVIAFTDRCSACDQPLDNHQLDDHEPIRNIARPLTDHATTRLEYARQAVGDAKAKPHDDQEPTDG